MRIKLFVGVLLLAATADAQSNIGSYLGPGILRRSTGDIGTRGGEQVDLRFFVGASGVVDTGYQAFRTDENGNLVSPGTLYGVSLNGGVYGVHKWRSAELGVDYFGDVRHYVDNSEYDSSNHTFRIGYAYRPNGRWILDTRVGGSVVTRSSAGGVSQSYDSAPTFVATLLDSRYYGLNLTETATYLVSARTSVTFGGGARYNSLKVPQEYRTLGYDVIGGFSRRVTARTTVGVDYAYSRDKARDGSFFSESHTVLGRYTVQMGSSWLLSLGAGVFNANVDRYVPFKLDPILTSIFGTDTLIAATHVQKTGPSGDLMLKWQKNRSSFSVNARRSILGSAGTYVASTAESASVAYHYSATRKLSTWIGISDARMTGIGTEYGKYNMASAGIGFSYELFPAIHLVGNYDVRHLDVTYSTYKRNPSSATLGLSFSPGTIPLSFR